MKKSKKFLIRNQGEISQIDISYFDQIKTRTLALAVGVNCFLEIQKVLKDDSLAGSNSYVGNMKVVTGLSRTLDELDKMYPSLITEIRSLDLKTNGQRLYRC